MTTEILLSLFLGIGLSACCGLKVFIPMLIGSVSAKMGWIPLSDNFEWLSSWPAITSFGVAAVVESLAYYIPFLDNLLDTINAPAAVIAGTVMSASALVDIDPAWQWILGLMVGGGSAGVIHAGSSILRLGSSKFTAGTGNAVINTGEIGTSILGSILAIATPIFVGIVALVSIFVIVFLLFKLFFSKSKKKKTESL